MDDLGEGGRRDGATVAADSDDKQGNSNYGPWMIATKRGRPRLIKEGGNQRNYGKNLDGSRFNILIIEEISGDKNVSYNSAVKQARDA